MAKTLKARNDMVIIKPIEEDELISSGNIVIPDMGKERPELGLVVDVGPGRISEYGTTLLVRSCKVGDKVIIPKIGTLSIDFEGDSYFITSQKEILAVIKE